VIAVKKLSSLSMPKLSGQLGVGLCLLGFLLVFLGWNGAASRDRVPAQFPYLISGGVAGLCLVVLGVGMIVVQNQRADRAALQASIDRLREAVERSGTGGSNGSTAPVLPSDAVLAGRSSYHRPECHLVEGRDAEVLGAAEAADRGLTRCRVCKPAVSSSAGGR
jgi:hypothetical protein